MRRFLIMIAVSVIVAFSPIPYAADVNGLEATFHEANKAYSDGAYTEAENGYRKLLQGGVDSAAIHNNLGEALYRQGKVGEAIFQFTSAHKQDPRNADIKYNLDYARNRITDKITRARPNIFLRPFSLAGEQLSTLENWELFIVCSFLLWGVLAIYLFYRRDWLKWIVWVLGMLFIFSSVVLFIKVVFTRPFGVVTASEASVYSGPDSNNVLLFKLHGGTDFELVSGPEGGWIRIQLSDGKQGWIAKGDIITGGHDK